MSESLVLEQFFATDPAARAFFEHLVAAWVEAGFSGGEKQALLDDSEQLIVGIMIDINSACGRSSRGVDNMGIKAEAGPALWDEGQ